MAADERVALGFRAHSGWAVVVAVAGSLDRPVVLDRRRIEIAGASVPRQPYHAAAEMEPEKAEEFLRRCREECAPVTTAAIRALLEARTVVAAGILFAAGRALPELPAILRSHALIHTAEGEFYREALMRACGACSLPVVRVKEREVWATEDLQRRINALGKTLGPPWRQDEKLAAMAGWTALGSVIKPVIACPMQP